MGFKNKKKKGKRRIRSNDSENNEVAQKAGRSTDSPKEVSVSSILGETNSILYNEETSLNLERVFDTSFEDSNADSETDALKICHENSHPTHKTVMASSNSKQIQSPSAIEDIGNKSTVMPTNADLLSCLRDISSRLDNVDKKLQKLDLLEEKVVSFEKDMKKLWAEVHENRKKVDERIGQIEERVESSDYSLGIINEKVTELEKGKKDLREEVVYLQAQSMRNNLVFGNISETKPEIEDAESVLRNFLSEKMKIAQSLVDSFKFERVHRMGPRSPNQCRKIVAKFTYFKQRELVRKQWKTLQGTPYFVTEQFPKEVMDKRRKLVPLMKEYKKEGKRAWITYDTLYVDGKPIKKD